MIASSCYDCKLSWLHQVVRIATVFSCDLDLLLLPQRPLDRRHIEGGEAALQKILKDVADISYHISSIIYHIWAALPENIKRCCWYEMRRAYQYIMSSEAALPENIKRCWCWYEMRRAYHVLRSQPAICGFLLSLFPWPGLDSWMVSARTWRKV